MEVKLKSFIGETFIYGLATVFSRVFTLLLIPFYAEILGKDDYANFVLLQSSFAVITFLLALNSGVFFYYYKHPSSQFKNSLISTWFFYQLAVSLLFILIILLSKTALASLLIENPLNTAKIKWLFPLISLQLVSFSVINSVININRIERKPKRVALVVLFESLLSFAFIFIALSFLNYGIIGVVIAQSAAKMIVAIFLIPNLLKKVSVKLNSYKILSRIVSYSFPFFIMSSFYWMLQYADKFLGVQLFQNQEDVAYLSLATQIVLPITILADMIRMALGPYVMSIHKTTEAHIHYQKIFNLTVNTASLLSILIVLGSPLLLNVLSDKSYYFTLLIVPFFAFGTVLSIIANQFSISFNLERKNTYLLLAVVISGIVSIGLNYLLLSILGIMGSGITFVFSNFILFVLVYSFSISKNKFTQSITPVVGSFLLLFLFHVLATLGEFYPFLAHFYIGQIFGTICMFVFGIKIYQILFNDKVAHV